MQKITTFLWFDNNAEEAINFYLSVFKNGKIKDMVRQGDGGPVFTATFELEGQEFYALNGGPMFKFNEAISLFVKCDTQEEIDHFWEKLSEGGEKSRCGWLKDQFGLCWQIVPPILGELMKDKNQVKASSVIQAMMQMDKIIIQDLKDAYDRG
jgi:predicted 3-demethylubiquinone-9 3-methyltransferase (glyoxalase superfamily)